MLSIYGSAVFSVVSTVPFTRALIGVSSRR